MQPEYAVSLGFGIINSANGIKHTGVDEVAGYGKTYHAKYDGEYVYKILDKEHPANDGSGFTGVFTIIDNGVECFEFLYGHGDALVTIGQICHRGQEIMTEANHGEVYSGNTRITLEMQANGDKRGSHAHNQKRILRKDKNIQPNTQYITGMDSNPYYKDGFYYAIPFYNNGTNGCVDWRLPIFTRDLFVGCKGYDVQCLQNFLKARGFLQIEQTTDFFGIQTKNALSSFQKANNINPMLGYFGKQTRNLVLSILN